MTSLSSKDHFKGNTRKFAYLKKFGGRKYIAASGTPRIDFEIFLTADPAEDVSGVRIEFLNVKELRLGNLDGMLNIHLEITDVTSWGLEEIRFKIVDTESESVRFSCGDYEVVFSENA
jgi:hypothetical protein